MLVTSKRYWTHNFIYQECTLKPVVLIPHSFKL